MKIDEELAHDRLLSFQQYLDQVCLNPALKYSPEFEAFLLKPEDELTNKVKPPRTYSAASNFIQEKSEPLHIFDMKYPGGRINLMMDTKMRGVSHEISRVMTQLLPLEKEATAYCKEIHSLQETLSKLYKNLGKVCSSISTIYKDLDSKVKFPNIEKLGSMYSGLNRFMDEHHKMFARESKNFGDNIRAMFDFSVRELEGIHQVRLSNQDRRRKKFIFECLSN